MKFLRADWQCDRCGAEQSTSNTQRPDGWHEVDVQIDRHLPPYIRHFCSGDCLNRWKKEAGL